jgi:hypothetical protein
MAEQNTNPDFIWGADAIAVEIGLSKRATFHLLSQGRLPAKKVGARYVAHRGRLRAYLLGDEARQDG